MQQEAANKTKDIAGLLLALSRLSCCLLQASLALSLFVCLSLSVSLYLSLFVCLSLSVSLYLSLFICLSLSLSLLCCKPPLSPLLSLTASLFKLSPSFCLSVSFLSVSFYLS